MSCCGAKTPGTNDNPILLGDPDGRLTLVELQTNISDRMSGSEVWVTGTDVNSATVAGWIRRL